MGEQLHERGWHSITQRNASMIHDGNHSEGFTYDSKGRLVFTDPDGETTLFIRGQGDYATIHSEPTSEPAGKSTVSFIAEWVGPAILAFLAGGMFFVAGWASEVIGFVLAVLT